MSETVLTFEGFTAAGEARPGYVDGAWVGDTGDQQRIVATRHRVADLRVRRAEILPIFTMLVARYEADYAAYEADCAYDRSLGYRARHCEHGMSQWTDYDNICGGCEEGYTMGDPAQRRERALAEARSRIAESNALLALIREGMRLRVPDDVIDYAWLSQEWRRIRFA